MSKKLTKKSLSLVKKLRGELKEVEGERNRYRDRYCDQVKETEKKEEVIECLKDFRNGALTAIEVNFQGEINRLQEIIKWFIKPSTTQENRRERLEKYPHRFLDRP